MLFFFCLVDLFLIQSNLETNNRHVAILAEYLLAAVAKMCLAVHRIFSNYFVPLTFSVESFTSAALNYNVALHGLSIFELFLQ